MLFMFFEARARVVGMRNNPPFRESLTPEVLENWEEGGRVHMLTGHDKSSLRNQDRTAQPLPLPFALSPSLRHHVPMVLGQLWET